MNNIQAKLVVQPPAFIDSVYQYQNVNKDINLRERNTKFFHRKAIKWCSGKMCTYLESSKGHKFIYTLLRIFIRKYKINWFDLADNYEVVKDYIKMKLKSSEQFLSWVIIG